MLSRRNIRIKVMQLLYAKSRDIELTLDDLLRRYEGYGKRTLELYLFNLDTIFEVAHYAVKDETNRRAKHLPTDEDKRFSTKLYTNPVLQQFLLRGAYEKTMKKYPVQGRVDDDTIRRFYMEFLKTDIYKSYLTKSNNSDEEHRQIILELYKYLYNHESFVELLEEFSPSYIDDDSLIIGATKKTIKALPSDSEFHTGFTEEDKLTAEYGEQLLMRTYQKDEILLEDIKPVLKNWDAERVATIDMILMKMAVCELMYFPTIPTKVTINEYVDISKMYSTDKSKEFINGILDRLMKQLKEEGKIVKEGRGLLE
jgi:transcription antitermination protein NusB